MEGWKLPIQIGKTHQRPEQDLSLYSRSLERKEGDGVERKTSQIKCMPASVIANKTTHCGVFCFTLSDEQAVTLEAAMMKSRISMVAPGRPILKNLGLQCFMMVFTMSCRKFLNTIP